MADQTIPSPLPMADEPPDPAQTGDRRKEMMRNNPQFILALIITLCLFAFLSMLAWHPSPPDNRDLVNIIMTSITTGWVGVIGYFYGSSAPSRSKEPIPAKPTGGPVA